MSYNYIFCHNTNNYVNINSKKGKKILRNYLKSIIVGGSEQLQLPRPLTLETLRAIEPKKKNIFLL